MFGQLYRMNQTRMVALLAGQDTSKTVPACPDWSAADVIRHVTGLAADVVASDVAGYATESWTDAQVVSRRDTGYEQVVAEWNQLVEPLAAILDDVDASPLPEMITTLSGTVPRSTLPPAIVGDLLHHEFDLRHAFDNREDRDRPDVIGAGVGHVKALRPVFTEKGLPTVTVVVDGNPIDVGRDNPVASVHMTSFEALRSIGGRRTLDEIAAFEWEGDSERLIPHMVLPTMSAASEPLGEA